MTKLHYALYAVLFTIVALFAGWQGGTALAARQHSSRMDDATALTTLLAEAAERRQGHMVDSVTRIDRVTAESDVLAYQITWLNSADESSPFRTGNRARQYLVGRMCTTPETAFLLSKNVKVRLDYRDSSGKSLMTIPIGAADCAGVR